MIYRVLLILILLPAIAIAQTGAAKEQAFTGEAVSLDFKEIDIKDLFRFIADISGLNVILDPAVKGTLTLKLTNVPWDQALDLITKQQGLGYSIDGNVIRIAPAQKILQELKQEAELSKEQTLNRPMVTRIFRLSYAKASDAEKIVRKLLTARGSVIVDDRTNALIVTDIDTNMDAIN